MNNRCLAILALLLACFAANAARAVPITVNAVEYEVTTVTDSFPNLASTLQAQVWWGDEALARGFATALGDQLGQPNGVPPGIFGPLFSYEADSLFSDNMTLRFTGLVGGARLQLGRVFTYAIASPVASVPDTGATGLLCAMAIFGLGVISRRLR